MAIIKLNKTSLQTFINNLTSYADSVNNERSSCYWTLTSNIYPTDIDSTIDSGSTMASRTADIKTHASDLQTRLDEAVAMNESGILMAEGGVGRDPLLLPSRWDGGHCRQCHGSQQRSQRSSRERCPRTSRLRRLRGEGRGEVPGAPGEDASPPEQSGVCGYLH